MTIETIVNLKATTSGGQSVKSIREEIKQAKQEAIQFAREFGEFSPQATKAAAKVAALKDEMDDFNQRVGALNPDKFAAIAKVGEGVAKGFAGAQGAMALFGAETEATEKALLKVQSAMAFAQGVEGLNDMRKGLGQMAATVLPKVRAAFATTAATARTIGKALGIAAIIAGLILLVQNFQKVKKAILDVLPGLSKVFDFFKNLVQTVTDFVGVTSDATRAMDKMNASLSKQSEAIGFQIDQLEAMGGKEAEVYKLKAQLIENDLQALRNKHQAGKALSEDEWKTFRQLQNDKKVLQLQEEARLKQAAENELKTQKDKQDKQRQLAAEQAAAKKAADEKALQEQKDFNYKIFLLEREMEETRKKAEEDKQKKDQEDREKAGANLDTYLKGIDAQRQYYADKEEARKRAEAQMEQQLMNDSMSILSSLGTLVGEQTAAGKTFALLQIAADTARALSGALANSQSPTPDNVATGGLAGLAKFASIAAVILSNVARAKQILQSGQQSASFSATPNLQGVSSLQPVAPPTQLQSSSQFSGMGQVYVLESDISSTQGRVAKNKRVSVF